MLKPEAYDKYEMDEYPLGTNAIVAVISYTGQCDKVRIICNISLTLFQATIWRTLWLSTRALSSVDSLTEPSSKWNGQSLHKKLTYL